MLLCYLIKKFEKHALLDSYELRLTLYLPMITHLVPFTGWIASKDGQTEELN